MIYDADAEHALDEDSEAFKAELRLAQMLGDAYCTLDKYLISLIFNTSERG